MNKKSLLIIMLGFFLTLAVAVLHAQTSPKKAIDVSQEAEVFASKAPELNKTVLNVALKAYHHAQEKGIERNPELTIIDYSLPSNKKRLWVLDMMHHTVLYYTYVAHGKNSGVVKASHFSNKPGSKASSLGVFLTENTYYGHKGLSLRLKGLEAGINDNAERRAVVIHGAWYATTEFLKNHNRLGLSWGCPAISTEIAKGLINTIKNGSLLVAYYPNNNWLNHSSYL